MHSKSFVFAIGDKLRDVVTGFTGVVTARGDFITGCNQYGLCPAPKNKHDVPKAEWFDENRLTLVKAAAVKLPRTAATARPNTATVKGGPQRDLPPI